MQIQTYTMFGKSARVFPFPPNWASPVIETLEWKTDVLRSRDGREQRRALRENPRRSFEYDLLLNGEISAMFESYLWGWQDRYFALPVWTDIGKLTAGVPIGQSTLPVVTDTLSFRANDFALIYRNQKTYEVVELQSIASTVLTLKAPVASAWEAGTKVYPLLLSHLSDSVKQNRHTSSVNQVNGLLFNTSADTAYSGIPGAAATTLYDGIELITQKPDWKSAIENEFTRAFDTVDTGIGPVGYFQTEGTSRIVRPFQWFLPTRADILDFRNLMGRLAGQSKTCWIPSWHDDFEVAGSNSADQTVITVKGTWFHTLVGVDTSRDRLFIRLPNGTTQYKRLLSTLPDYVADTTTLQLDSTLGTIISSGDNTRVGLLLRCRLASDKVVIPWITDSVANPQTTFTTVKI